MSYLDNKFRVELNEGNLHGLSNDMVTISGVTFDPLSILESASVGKEKPTVYDQAFNFWREEFVSQKLDEANDFLKSNSQLEDFATLQDQHNKSKLVPFVGAGLSFDSGYPLWRDFLLKLTAQKTKLAKEDILALLNQGLYEEAAEYIANAMPPQAFAHSVLTNFGTRKTPKGAIEVLPEIFRGHVVTTNFDHLLREVYKNASQPFASECIGHTVINIRKLLDDERVLLKLHGNADNPSGRVLTKSEYDTCYQAGKKLQDLLGLFADRYSLLFIGCRLDSDRPMKALKEHINAKGYNEMHPHYAFLELPNSSDERIQREHDLSTHHIYPIWYPKDEHESAITALLLKLHEDC